MLVFELVLKALARSKSFSLIFILNFSLAITSLSYLQFFKGNVDASLESQAKTLLGADLVVSSRFTINDAQIEDLKKKLPDIKEFSQGISTVSMVSSDKRARLMEIVKVHGGYPYYGGIVFKDKHKYPGTVSLPKKDEVWVYKEVLDVLELDLGDTIKIGKENYLIKKVIDSDTLKTISFSGFMPKIYMSEEGLKRSELLQFGSTARYKLNYLFQENLSNDELEKLENTLKETIDQNLRVLSPNDGRNRLLNVLSFLTNFLSLVSLITFFLGLVGLIYLYSGFLRKHQKDIRVLNDLGIRKSVISLTYLLHLFVLVFVSSIIVFALMIFSTSFIVPMLQELIDFDFEFALDYVFFLKSLLVLVLISISLGLPLILPHLQRKRGGMLKTLLVFVPFIIVLLLLSHFVTPSKNVGFFFALVVFLLIVLVFSIALFILKRADFSGHFENLSLSLALKSITRQNKTSITLFTAILLCTTFFSLIPQVGSSLATALTLSVDEKPRFFVVDAKEEQIKDLKEQVSLLGASLENIAPLLRARVITLNGVENEPKTNKLQNSAVNLSYRNTLKKSESIVEGREFSGVYDSDDFSKKIELSVEKRYADRRGIKLGDEIVFDILGLELSSVVVNIRKVSWTEFTPNFFFIFQEGVLNDAPKTLLATISGGEYDAIKMLLTLSDMFPLLTIIDVKSLFETFSELVDNVTEVTDKMSYYSIVVGLVMSFIIIHYQMNLQKNNILRLKMIGVKNNIIRNSFLIQFGLISLGASSLGIILGSVGSYIISDLLFQSYWDFRPVMLLSYFLFIPLLTLAIVSAFISKVTQQRENILFGE